LFFVECGTLETTQGSSVQATGGTELACACLCRCA